MNLSDSFVHQIAAAALAEDLGTGDITSEMLIPPEATGQARIVAKEPGVLAGLALAAKVFECVDPELRFETLLVDGDRIAAGQWVARIAGPARGILAGERVALNFLQRLSGVASLTAEFVKRIEGTGACILDTRKTTPGLRALEKYAVHCGGGTNHRFGLYDAFLLKDNHRALLAALGAPLGPAVRRAREGLPAGTVIEVEIDTLAQLDEVIEAAADIVLLDNMSPEDMRAAVDRIGGRMRTEASGGIALDNVRAAAEAGVDFISIGALTHSAPALDLSLELFE